MSMNPGKKLRFSLIGCGQIAHKHIIALRKLPGIEIAGVFDINGDAVRSFSEKYNLPGYTDLDRLVREQSPDVFDILTPSGLHAENILSLLEYNRHFVVEKPLALRLDQIDSVLEECDKRGLRIFVVKQNRFNPPIRALKKAVDKGRFGKMVLGTVRVRWCRQPEYYAQKAWRGTWLYDGGVLANQASHHIDMLVWMMGRVESVMAKGATLLAPIEAEDTAVVILRFASGALGIIEATTAARPKDLEGSISILGEHGSVEVGGFFMNELKTWNFSSQDPMDTDVWSSFSKVPAETAWNHTEFFKDVVTGLSTNTRGLVEGLEGRKTVELLNAIYESSTTGKEVFLNAMSGTCKLGMHNDK